MSFIEDKNDSEKKGLVKLCIGNLLVFFSIFFCFSRSTLQGRKSGKREKTKGVGSFPFKVLR